LQYKIVHISDLHFGPPFRPDVGQAVIQFIDKERPHFVVVSGDLTQRAKKRQFEAAKIFLDRLPAKCRKIVVPGNHDIPLYRVWERLVSPYGLFRKVLGLNPEDQVHEQDGIKIVALNSTHPYRRIKDGHLTFKQLEMCRAAFANQGGFKVLVLHHHLFSLDHLRSRALPSFLSRFLTSLEEAGVDMVLSGHAHKSYILNSLDIAAGGDGQRKHGVLVVNCGTTTSRRGRGTEHQKNTLNMIELGGGEIKIAHNIFVEAEGFRPLSHHSFKRNIG
jgi:predicted MPP superfamily phosphohydrolase